MSSLFQILPHLIVDIDRSAVTWLHNLCRAEGSILHSVRFVKTFRRIWSLEWSIRFCFIVVAFLNAQNPVSQFPLKQSDISLRKSSVLSNSRGETATYCYWLECLDERSNLDHFVFSKSPSAALDAFLGSGLTANISSPIFTLRRVRPPVLETTLGKFELLPSRSWRPIPTPVSVVKFDGTESVIDEDISGHFLFAYICDFSHLGIHRRCCGVSVSPGPCLKDIERLFEGDELMNGCIWRLLQTHQGGAFRVTKLKKHISLLIDKCWQYSKLSSSLFKDVIGEDILIYVTYSNILRKVIFSEHAPIERQILSRL